MDGIKQKIGRLPGVSALKREVHARQTGARLAEAGKEIDRRLAEKIKKGEKINAVFVCHRPAVWGALRSVYEALAADDRFNVIIVAIPNKKQLPGLGLNHEQYESEGAEAFWKEYGCVNGYDYETGEWLDLKSLAPDYLFFQQPYNITRCAAYRSEVVSAYAKIGYVCYFTPYEFGPFYDECLPEDFLKDVSFFFSQNKTDDLYIKNRVKSVNHGATKVILTGYPKYDVEKNYADLNQQNRSRGGKFSVIWTPRWTTNEGFCHFFEYRDRILEYADRHPEVDLTFRPHPQAFLEWTGTGELSEEELADYLRNIERRDNLHLNQAGNYFPMLYASDCLLTDVSSLIYDYLLTGKPIVLCMPENIEHYLQDVLDGLYKVSSWDEATAVLEKLQKGEDPLSDIRRQIVAERMNISKEGAGKKIAEVIRKDAGF